MKRITLYFLLLFTQTIFAQFSSNDVKYFVGQGNATAYLVVDFNDGTFDESQVWGIRFDSNNPIDGTQMLALIADEEPNFSFEQSGGFLDQIAFNNHDSYEQEYDYWSLWASANGNDWNMSGWMSSDLQNGTWYGASYGFMFIVPEPIAPANQIPAYSSQWFQASQITNWIGTGTNKSLVVVDFGTQTNNIENSFVFGIQYNGTITAEQALQLIQTETTYFNFTTNSNQVATLNLASNSGTATASNTWKIYEGTDLSNWQTKTDLAQVTLSNNDWLGLSFSARRPFTPQVASPTLSNPNNQKIEFSVYPNPTSDYLNIQSEGEILEVSIFNVQGKQILKSNTDRLDVTNLTSGIYLIEVETNYGKAFRKFIKK